MIDLLRDLGLFGLAVAALGWVAKTLGQHFIDQRFSVFESELNLVAQQQKLALDQDLERHKSDLNLEYIKRSRIHEQRLEVMSHLYELLVELDETMQEVTALLKTGTGEDRETRRQREMKEAHEAYRAFRHYFTRNRILLSEDTCSLVERLESEYAESFRIGTFPDRWNAPYTEGVIKMAQEASDKVRKHIPPLRQELEQDFRRQLGTVGAS